MPELPEVKTIQKYLIKKIKDSKILKSTLIVAKSLRTSFEINGLNGQNIINIHRKGKQLVFETDDYYIGFHLRMEGKFLISHEKPNLKYTIIYFKFKDKYLLFNDFRKFATIDIYSKEYFKKWSHIPIIKKLGPEPFKIDPEYLYDILHIKRVNIKSVLLNQEVISGLGNIYVNEVLYITGISPFKISNKISQEETRMIVKVSIDVLNKAIKYGGTTISTFATPDGNPGKNQNILAIHKKKECPKGHPVKFDKVGGRGTYWCPICQK